MTITIGVSGWSLRRISRKRGTRSRTLAEEMLKKAKANSQAKEMDLQSLLDSLRKSNGSNHSADDTQT